MSTVDEVRRTEPEVRRRCPQLPEPLVLVWSDVPVVGLDRGTPWVYMPVGNDPHSVDGRIAVPRRARRELRAAARWNVRFDAIAVAHQLDPAGPARGVLSELADGPRTCTDAVAAALVGPQPAHPAVRGAAGFLDAVVGRRVARAVANALDPIVFGVIGVPTIRPGQPALFYPLTAWKW